LDASAPAETQLVEVATGIRMNYRRVGHGDPLLMIMGTSGSLGLWGQVEPGLVEAHEVISFDNRGLGKARAGLG